MKVTSAAIALALSGSAVAAGGADTVNAVLSAIADDLKKFDSAINGWSGGDTATMDAASKQIQSDTEGGASKIAAADALSLVDAAGITANVQGLQTQLDNTLADLKKIGQKLASSGQCGNIQGQLKSQGNAAQSLQDAITSKTPPEAKSIAQQLGGAIGASIKETQSTFDQLCAGASSSGPSGSSSGSSPKPATSSGSGSSAPAGHSGGHGAGSSSKPATTSSVPKPATYTGAGSTVKVPFAVALALAVFAL